MNRIVGRTWFLLLLVFLLLGGLGFFVYEYAVTSHKWIMHSGNPHVYQGSAQLLACGRIVDRDGALLVDMTNGRIYSPDDYVRAATLHWVGDRSGNITAPVLNRYAGKLTGFSPVKGIYSYGGTGAQARLTLSVQVQKAALEALGRYKGTIAVMNYRTGEMLCAVSTPSFDPDNIPDFSLDTTGLYEGVYLNRFLQSAYIPGSIFKIVTTAAALERITDIRRQQFTCTGSYRVGADRVTCEVPHGKVNLRSAMTKSCNCYYAWLTLQMGAEEMEKYVDIFDVIKPVEFDGVRTVAGNFQAVGEAPVEIAWSGVGQHKDQINPCSYLTFVGAIANGGQGVNPYIMAQVGDYQAAVRPMDRILSVETAQVLQEFMRGNVVNNYGAENFPGLTVCGKSGTGQVGGGKRANATFAGFTTDEEYPLAFIAVVEDAGYGNHVCVPMLSKVLSVCRDVLSAA